MNFDIKYQRIDEVKLTEGGGRYGFEQVTNWISLYPFFGGGL